MYDVIVIGGGPAGLTACVYALRANKSVLVIEKATFGGQITYSPKVENYPAFTEISGNELGEKLVEQVLAQGADVEMAEVLSIEDGNPKKVITDSGEYTAKAVIIATGARHRMLGLENEENLVGNGISFCAVCDGAFYKDKHVGVVGGGNSALQEALLLCETAAKVTVIQNLPYFTGEERLVQKLRENPKAEILLGKTVAALQGESELCGVVLQDAETKEKTEVNLDGLFVAIGLIPQNEPFASLLELSPVGYAEADESCLTKTKGVFVAGDCRTKAIRQVATAVADGAVAALAACDYIDNL